MLGQELQKEITLKELIPGPFLSNSDVNINIYAKYEKIHGII